MAIEDIDFLGENSTVDSTLFFLDSDSRNRSSFPTPAEYVVQFSEPIKFVVGVDILDATIPATMYVVDWHNDTLSVTMLDAPSDHDGREAALLLSNLVTASPPLACAMSTCSTRNLYCQLVSYDMSDAGVNIALGHPVTTNDMSPNQCMVVVDETSLAYSLTPASMHDVMASSKVSSILALRKAVVTLQHGNYDIISLQSQILTGIRGAGALSLSQLDQWFSTFTVVSTSAGLVTLQGRYAFVNTHLPFVLDMLPSSSSCSNVLGFDTLPVQGDGLGYLCVPSLTQAFSSVHASSIPSSVMSNPLYKATSYNMIVAPGVVNLLGVRFITLRCKEIEQHLYSGMAYGNHSTGLGVFKLPTGNEVSNLRFDFVSLVQKNFHPIGRLSRLTLRFEFNNGLLYDFKGINNQVMLAVKFLAPGKRVPLTRSVLNPDYDPDFLRYTTRSLDGSHGLGELTGVFPVVPPYQDADEGGGVEVDSVPPDVSRRREIAQRLLNSQDKYDYPAPGEDSTSWRAVT